jgi:hypothetical protein
MEAALLALQAALVRSAILPQVVVMYFMYLRPR